MTEHSFLSSTEFQLIASKKRWRHDDAVVILQAWKRSGLSIAEFARRSGIHPWRIGRWRNRIMEEIEAQQPKILPVKILPDNSPFTSTSHEGPPLEIALPRGVKLRTRLNSLKDVAQLVILLEECPC